MLLKFQFKHLYAPIKRCLGLLPFVCELLRSLIMNFKYLQVDIYFETLLQSAVNTRWLKSKKKNDFHILFMMKNILF